MSFDSKNLLSARKSRRDRSLWHRYRIRQDDFERLEKEQNFKCPICLGKPKMLVVDHCHKYGHVRGLLCFKCNNGLGFFKNSPARLKRAIEYLDTRKKVARQDVTAPSD